MIPSEVKVYRNDGRIRLEVEDAITGWMEMDDSFIGRIDESNLNPDLIESHLMKEIQIKNLLDEATSFLDSEKFAKAVECFDGVLFYDPEYGEALIGKSHALFGQRHYVKALRYYRCAVSTSDDMEDVEYRRMLLAKSGEERDSFPKLKSQIYAGDECFAMGDYENALKSYEKALANPSKLKEKILFKLYNKKAKTHLILNDFESALICFNESLNQLNNDFAWYGKGVCEYELDFPGAGESLKNAVNLSKDQLLEKGLIQNELGLYHEALETFDFILQDHFKADDMLVTASNGRMLALRELGMDSDD